MHHIRDDSSRRIELLAMVTMLKISNKILAFRCFQKLFAQDKASWQIYSQSHSNFGLNVILFVNSMTIDLTNYMHVSA